MKRRNRVEEEVAELKQQLDHILEEINWFAITNDNYFDLNRHELLQEVDNVIAKKDKEVSEMMKQNKVCDAGPCLLSIDKTLQSIGVECQAYYGHCINGNQCHVLLREENIDLLCNSLPAIVFANIGNENEVYNLAVTKCDSFKLLFKKYYLCHAIMNSAKLLTEHKIVTLQDNIHDFMMYLRCNWPDVSINPKLHMLEDHVVPFISRWHVGCGFYDEQRGGGSIDASINTKKGRFKTIKNYNERLKYIMNCHLSSTNPNCCSKRDVKKKRNLKRK